MYCNVTTIIVVMGATNMGDSLDDALIRPGRLTRQIYCGLPDKDGREEIFNVHLKKIKTELPPSSYASDLAAATPGMSGAQIANICNEAAIRATREGSELINKTHFDAAVERVHGGIEKKNATTKFDEKRILATIEGGKCLVSWLLESQDTILKASIVPRTKTNLGYTQVTSFIMKYS